MSAGDPIKCFMSTIEQQREFVVRCEETDDHYANTPREEWKRRKSGTRGWTTCDIKRQDYFLFLAENNFYAPGGVKLRFRASTAIRYHQMHRESKEAWQAALSHARSSPEFEDVAPDVRRMGNLHLDWIEAIIDGRLDWFDAEEAEYKATFRQLARLIRYVRESKSTDRQARKARNPEVFYHADPLVVQMDAFIVQNGWDGRKGQREAISKELERLEYKLKPGESFKSKAEEIQRTRRTAKSNARKARK